MKKKLIEGEHFYYNEQGYMVLTAKYHLDNGNCCGNGCMNCPYDYSNVPEPRKSELQEKREAKLMGKSNLLLIAASPLHNIYILVQHNLISHFSSLDET
jgi:hypothetical protein